MGFDYNDLPKCRECQIPEMAGVDKYDCAIHWRPGTGTKFGFPTRDGFECPRDAFEKSQEKTESLTRE